MAGTGAEVDLAEALRRHFGFEAFLPGQREVLENLLAGHSAAAVFPTGGGKSLCYQLPSLLLDGLTLVVSPLIALMKDQIDGLAARGIEARRLDSTLTLEEHREVMDGVRSGRLRLLYVAPERVNNERFRAVIEDMRISLFAVDEAHCISEWGHDFRPDYLKLAAFAKRCRAERVLALTATATPRVLEQACAAFDIAPEHATRTGFHRENLTVLTSPVEGRSRDALLLQRLRERPPGPTIVYVTLQRTATDVARLLSSNGWRARHYHAGLRDDDRSTIQDWFMASHSGVVVATIAFGMGVDKADIRNVFHYNLPKSLENFSQEIGRSGRDGRPATCEMLACLDDLVTLENFALGDTPTLEAVQSLLEELFGLGESFDVSHHDLSNRHDIRVLVLRTLITQLKLDGFLEGGTPFYGTYKFKPLASSGEILARFEGERREFLRGVFRQATKARTWFDLDLDAAARAQGTSRERIVKALDYLADERLLELKVAGVRHRYLRLRSPGADDVRALAGDLHGRQEEHEARELSRLEDVLALVRHDGCQVGRLGAYFGEPLDQPCGRCSWCLQGGRAAVLPERQARAVDETTWSRLRSLQREHADVLGPPRSLARFACGLTSPALTRAKLGRHALFGCLRAVPFRSVLERAAGDGRSGLGG